MDKFKKKKFKVIAILASGLILAFIAIFVKAYLNEKRRDKALKYYNEISTVAILADTLGMDLECSNNKGNTWVIKGNNTSLIDIVTQDVADYISGDKQSLYSYKIIENENTLKYIKNFNNNMKHIRISGENGAGIPIPPKTISEGEGMEEFKEIKNLEELVTYMHKVTKNGEYYLYALSLVGLDGSGSNGKITYVSDNGEEKILRDSGRLSLFDLFEKLE